MPVALALLVLPLAELRRAWPALPATRIDAAVRSVVAAWP